MYKYFPRGVYNAPYVFRATIKKVSVQNPLHKQGLFFIRQQWEKHLITGEIHVLS